MTRFPGTCREQDSFYLKLNTQIKTAVCFPLGSIHRSKWPEYCENKKIVTVTTKAITAALLLPNFMQFLAQFKECQASQGILTSGSKKNGSLTITVPLWSHTISKQFFH